MGEHFKALSEESRIIVALAVLIDGYDAIDILKMDKERGAELAQAATEVVRLSPDIRMPLIGTYLRDSLASFT